MKLVLIGISSLLALAAYGCVSTRQPPATQAAPVDAPGKSDAAGKRGAPRPGDYAAPVVLARLEDRDVTESSGLAASRQAPGIFWTHNDSDGGPYIYAFDRRGKRRGVWRVSAARARDWEDIATGPGPEPGRQYLYVGDIGDNEGGRTEIVVYRFAEPAVAPADSATTKASPGQLESAEVFRLKYPDGAHDAETLMVHPRTGDLYVVTKQGFGAAGVYKLKAPLPAAKVDTLAFVGNVSAPGPFGGVFTGGDISPDGARVVLCDYASGYELRLPSGRAGPDFDAVWKQPLAPLDLGPRRQGEAVCYSHDGAAVLATTEGRHPPLIEVRRADSAPQHTKGTKKE